jgi:NAD+--asparagine ADP-ribosyltransferase
MPRRKKSEMTYAQRVTDDNNKFRKDALAQALETTDLHNAGRSDDINQFRKDSYKQALKDAKDAGD